jgi:hypothetical protein
MDALTRAIVRDGLSLIVAGVALLIAAGALLCWIGG